ncbi:aquaporin-like protein [Diplodia corticola]|uniref:Aquaporin-like protein n=1 Tax=Diplodia corticola TaxID=236234 RepID=A0A1J9R6T9_9PEZI|nr:aquaporin-like protein [Diplodia corticola]OJD36249.1 aquaporin-like protein [Diplodia corticola]
MPSSPEDGDHRGLLTDQSSPPQGPSTSDLSSFQRTFSDEEHSSDRDDQHPLSFQQQSHARETTTRSEHEQSLQAKKEKVDELLALMEKSQRQIQQLFRSQQAVRDVMDDITLQDLPQGSPLRPRDGNEDLIYDIRRDGSKRTTDSKRSEMYGASARPEEPFRMPPHAKFQPPIDDDYYQLNPWYGQPPKRPVFGLGGPLPHTVRRAANNSEKEALRKQDPEMGQANPQNQEKLFSLGAPLPHKQGSRPVSSHEPSHSLARSLSSQRSRNQKHASRRKPQRKAIFKTPEETRHYNEKKPDEAQATAYQTGTDEAGPQYGDGQSQEHLDPFASFDRIGEDYDAEEEDNNAKSRGRNEQEGDGPDATEWAIDSEPIGQYDSEKGAETGEKDPNELRNWWARIRAKHPEPLAEFLCTLVSIFLGLCATLQVNLAKGEYGDYETSCWAWGIAFMFGIYVGGGVSGAHMNPAISLSLWLFRGFPRRQMLIYWGCQLLACTCAAALAFGVFRDTILDVDPGLVDTATSFYSKPQAWVGATTAFSTQLIAAAVMMMSVLALGDDQNNPPGAGLHALVMGLVVTAQKMTLGSNTGVALNPASDFGPRLVCLMVGFNTDMFTERGFWWLWGPWAATGCGSIVGCSMYDSLVFVGSESPINYKMAGHIVDRVKKAKRLSK